MNARERMLATLNHVKPDRVPIQLGWRPEVMAAVKKHYKVDSSGEVAKILDADLYRTAKVPTRFKEFEKRAGGKPPGVLAQAGGFAEMGPAIMLDDRTFQNEWGVVRRLGEDGKYLEWVSGPFSNTDDLDSFDWPGERVIMDDPGLAAKVAAFKSEGYFVVGSSGLHPFKQAWHMRGFENFLCDYAANPEFVEKLYDRILGFTIPMCKRSAAAGVDLLDFWGDVSMQDRMIVPPDAWRAIDKPAWKRIITETRKVNPDVRFFFHSDGNITPIIDDLIEVGFDILNPLQPECVNPAEIKAKWGKRLTLDGGGSVQRTLPFGTLKDVKREVDFLMTSCAYDGGYIFRASNAVQFDAPVENVVTYYEYARDWDLSKLEGPPKKISRPPCLSIKVKA